MFAEKKITCFNYTELLIGNILFVDFFYYMYSTFSFSLILCMILYFQRFHWNFAKKNMYALEAPPGPHQQLSTSPAIASSVAVTSSTSSNNSLSHHNLEQMSSNLYNLDSASVSANVAGYSHPSTQSPYNNLTASSLLLPSTSDYHHLELNVSSAASNMEDVHTRLNPG